MSSTLDKLFGSAEFVRLLKIFMLNPGTVFENKEISRRAKIKPATLNTELKTLASIKFIKKKTVTVTEEVSSKSKQVRSIRIGKPRTRSRRITGWQLNSDFELLAALRTLLFNVEPFKDKEILAKFKNTGQLKVVVVAGAFIFDPDSRADLLIAGNNLKRDKLEKIISNIEADIGRELQYAVLDTKEFKYRLDVYDKFIRDILDYPHRVLLDKVGL